MFDHMYYVDLKNVSSGLDDDAIYDVFKMKGMTHITTPTFQVGALTSRESHGVAQHGGLPKSADGEQHHRSLRNIFP
ncbi:hypothetical protein PR003_g3209 [Phytophthora rubi]|uniref:Uncharacterized protein n=1 Tax=Phytophthora rubi TaxID=129364 RepID=A0A6A4FQP8_9STRA|nr:hypothetical protein PR002_g3105 [Phytophthora rubi]KAE9050284.1 hypothetical protein PR001_g2528 [Phytophthora rubi]KAE9354744.1 hypothetical protein PR003_g3209 [Phytophthora rubi]